MQQTMRGRGTGSNLFGKQQTAQLDGNSVFTKPFKTNSWVLAVQYKLRGRRMFFGRCPRWQDAKYCLRTHFSEKRTALAGHILRTDNSDPLRQVLLIHLIQLTVIQLEKGESDEKAECENTEGQNQKIHRMALAQHLEGKHTGCQCVSTSKMCLGKSATRGSWHRY